MTAAFLRLAVVALHFICPLIFFTDLTRNPYFTQIALLNMLMLAACALALASQGSEGAWRLPKTPLDLPLAVWAGICVLSWLVAYFGHRPFFRESMLAEGARAFLFTGANTLLPFFLAALLARDLPDEPDLPLGRWTTFALIWSALWLGFAQMRGPAGGLLGIWDHLWDPYGALLWAGGLAAMLLLARGFSVHHVWHVALATGFFAAAYGVAQYFNHELIWPKALNPYGGRSVSTFGNPNFMSSYLVILFPLAGAYYLQARTRSRRALYAVLLLTFEAGLLCSLTRSSWAGALAAMAALLLSPELRARFKEDAEFNGLVAGALVVMALAWPQANAQGYTASAFGRITEMSGIFKATGAQSYSPWYQRVLIWTCSWMMGAENPVTGKGWGLFELFYPFYQGNILDNMDFFRAARTHANNAHNELLEVWAQAGILGLGATLWIWTTFFRAASESRRSPWVHAAAAGVFGMLVDNLLNVSLHFAVPAFLFWWQAGTAMGHIAHRRGWTRTIAWKSRGAALSAASAVFCLAAWGGWNWTRQWNREVRYFLGFKLMRRGPLSQAIDMLTSAHRWHPREVNTNYELGNAHAQAEQYDKAIWAYEEALKSNAGYDEIYYNMGTIYAGKLGDRERALKNFAVSLAINPLSYSLYDILSRYYMGDAAGNRAEAAALLERAVHFFPSDPSFLNNLGYLYNLGKEDSKAEDVYIRLLSARPDMAVAETNLRASLARSGRKSPAVLEKVGEFRELERRIRAQDYGDRSLSLARGGAEAFPSFPAIWFYLGNLELIHGDARSAEEHLKRAIAMDPQNQQAKANLAQALLRQGKNAEAQALAAQ